MGIYWVEYLNIIYPLSKTLLEELFSLVKGRLGQLVEELSLSSEGLVRREDDVLAIFHRTTIPLPNTVVSEPWDESLQKNLLFWLSTVRLLFLREMDFCCFFKKVVCTACSMHYYIFLDTACNERWYQKYYTFFYHGSRSLLKLWILNLCSSRIKEISCN